MATAAEKIEMAGQLLSTTEWDMVLGKMLRYHFTIGEEIRVLIQQIRKEMKEELVPVAEDRANYGKIVKQRIRDMWSLEYEIAEIQQKFLESLGSIDINNLTDDFVEDVMIQSKPLQGVLKEIRKRQKETMEEIKKEYEEKFKDLEPMTVARPPKPVPAPEAPPPKEEDKPKEGEGEKPAGDAAAAPPAEGEAPPAADAAAPAEPAPAVDAAAAPAAVEASA